MPTSPAAPTPRRGRPTTTGTSPQHHADTHHQAPVRDDAPVVAALLRERRSDFTRAELRVAQALLRDYPAIGLQSAAGLAAAAGVSGPTVVRLVAKLGYPSYAHLQRQLRAELSARTTGPVELYPDTKTTDRPRGPLLARVAPELGRAVAETLGTVDDAELDRAIALLADPSHRVLLTGGRASIAHAYYMATYLQLLRPGVHFLGPGRAQRTAALLDADPPALVVLFDFHRYERDTIDFGQAAAARGGTLIVFTDRYLTPLAPCADVLFTAAVDGLRPFIVLTPVLALVETTLLGVAEALGPAGRARLADFDQLNTGQV